MASVIYPIQNDAIVIFQRRGASSTLASGANPYEPIWKRSDNQQVTTDMLVDLSKPSALLYTGMQHCWNIRYST